MNGVQKLIGALLVLMSLSSGLMLFIVMRFQVEDTTFGTLQEAKHAFTAPDKDGTNSTALFLQRYCNLSGVEWYPGDWQQRTPYFLAAGVKKSGTTSLAFYLFQHPQIALTRSKELHTFSAQEFKHYDAQGRTMVKATRDDMYLNDYPSQVLQNNSSMIAFDASPSYFFLSTTIPAQVLCTCPWVKILLILRDPVERVLSHYHFVKHHMELKRGIGTFTPLEPWIEKEMTLLRKTGVVQDWNLVDFDSFTGSKEEYDAWSQYLPAAWEGVIGHSMYSVSLQHWYDALKEIGRNPETEILAIKFEDLKNNSNRTLNQVLSWLNLPEYSFRDQGALMVTKNVESNISISVREKLEEFFKPYNRRLSVMLGNDWNWDATDRAN